MDVMLLAYLVIAMQLVDVALTYLVIKAGGREVNPVMVKLQKIIPGKWTWLFLMKAAFIVGVYLATRAYQSEMTVPLIVVIAAYAWVLWNNYRAWKK